MSALTHSPLYITLLLLTPSRSQVSHIYTFFPSLNSPCLSEPTFLYDFLYVSLSSLPLFFTPLPSHLLHVYVPTFSLPACLLACHIHTPSTVISLISCCLGVYRITLLHPKPHSRLLHSFLSLPSASHFVSPHPRPHTLVLHTLVLGVLA